MSDSKTKKLEADGMEWLRQRAEELERLRMMGRGAAAYGAPPSELRTEFDVVLVVVEPADRIKVCKVLRSVDPLMPVADALALTQDLPKAVFMGKVRVEAEDILRRLREAGAGVRLR